MGEGLACVSHAVSMIAVLFYPGEQQELEGPSSPPGLKLLPGMCLKRSVHLLGQAYVGTVELSSAESMWLKVMGQQKSFPYMINFVTSPDKRLMGHQLPSSEILFSHTAGTDEKGNESADQPKKKPKSAESLHVIGGYGTFSRAFGNSLPEGSLPVIYEEINSLYKKTLRQKKSA